MAGGIPRKAVLNVLACVAPLFSWTLTQAHDARPLSVAIAEQSDRVYRVVVHAPPTLEAANAPKLIWPERCDARQADPLRTEISLVACHGGLEGHTIGIDYPFYNPSLSTLIRVATAAGVVHTAVLPPDQRSWRVPDKPDWRTVAGDYLLLGFEHIWRGPDHLLFVAGLLLLARRPRRMVLAVTGFTAAHSITLSLATLGVIHAPIAPVEAMIALSILFLAGEIARRRTDSLSHRFPVVLSFVFGLLHGFGFAAALGEIGLPAAELATGLLCFNLGVELGQLAFIGAVLVPLFAGLRWPALRKPAVRARFEARAGLACAYAIGIPAGFWFLERTAFAFG
jgi:hydrogenase/urease accessory protein HupE